jgi:triacylglycerol lipase
LKQTIISQSDKQGIRRRVLIIAHSMGGLDARYMLAHLGMADRVAALVTVATPHLGSPYADWCIKNLGERMGGMKLLKLLKLDMRAISDLSTASCAKFNETVPDHPDVNYFSVSAAREWHRVPPFLLHSYKLIRDLEGDNDGLVSVKSAAWGRHLATWPADHLHTINKRFLPEIRGKTGNIVPYYLKMLETIERNETTDEHG